MINWEDPSCRLTKYFTVREALWLPQWGRCGTKDDARTCPLSWDQITANLVETFTVMTKVRDILRCPIIVHNAWRPRAYNTLIKGSSRSAHMDGLAIDFSADMDWNRKRDGKDCDLIKEKLLPLLYELGIRMENNGRGATWVHVDKRPPRGRYFHI